MKLVAAIILIGGCAAAALWVPLPLSLPGGGRTLYQRAEEKGVPAATAQAVGSAARSVGTVAGSALRWATSKTQPVQPLETKAAARKAEEKPAPAVRTGHPERSDVQPAPPAVAHAPSTVPVAPKPVASEKARTLALAPLPLTAQAPAATGQDRIVRTAAPERISSGDRAALDQLVAKARR